MDSTIYKAARVMTILVLMSGFLAGCGHTFEGVGRDIESTGEWVQDVF